MSITLLEGDCLEVMKDLSDNSIDLFICDLPYGQLTGGFDRPGHNEEVRKKVSKQTNSCCAWDIKIDLEAFWKEVQRLKKNKNTPIIHFCNTKFGFELIESKKDWFRYDLVWNKERGISFLSANKMPMKSHEMIYVFSEEGAYYNRIDVETDKKEWKVMKRENNINPINRQYNVKRTTSAGNGNKRCVLSVVKFKSGVSSGKHPTEKPSELYKWLIERYCPPNGTLLDPTAGSFNSCFAGFELDRNCIGIEKNTEFYQKACQKADTL